MGIEGRGGGGGRRRRRRGRRQRRRKRMRDREKGRVDLQLRRESQAVTDRQTNLTALSFSSFSLLLRLHSRPASPMHRIAHTCTCSYTYLCCEPRCPFPLFFAFRVPTSLSLSIPADLRVFLRLSSLSFSLPLFLVSFLAFLSLRFLQHLPTPYSSRHRDVPSLPSSSVLRPPLPHVPPWTLSLFPLVRPSPCLLCYPTASGYYL